MPSLVTATAIQQPTITGVPLMTLRVEEHACCNPFRIPRHYSRSNLRVVPDIIRTRLPRVSFTGPKICTSCRNRVYLMLKERKILKPSPRLSDGDKRRNEPHRKSSDPIPPATSLIPASPKKTSLLAEQPANPPSTTVEVEDKVSRPTVSSNNTVESVPATETVQVTPKVEYKKKKEPKAGEIDAPGTSTAFRSSSFLDTPNLTDDFRTSTQLSTMSRRSKTQQIQNEMAQLRLNQVCCFCGLSEDNELEFGKFYRHSGIVTHYYCLLLSSNMEQKGNDDEGILGFLADDIQKEIRRGKRLFCSHCKKNGATLGCCNAKCKRIFHFPCGLKNGSLHQFFGEFRSYCINHRPKQKIDEKVKREIKNMTEMECCICYEKVDPLDSNGTLWAPCCKKNAWFHRKCVQQLAMSTGYFFKCPLCNNKVEFQLAMLEHGIYIPRQDASWELVPNAFEELLYRHDQCDAKACLCPRGKKYSSNGKWELILCRLCGSQGVHILCGQLKLSSPKWDCPECLSILRKPDKNGVQRDESSSDTNETSKIENVNAGNILISTVSDDDSDSDISVGNESSYIETQEPVADKSLRPGPKSFKNRQIAQKKNTGHNLKSNSSSSISNMTNNSIQNLNVASSFKEVICLESDDEAVEILCESAMRNRSKQGLRFNNADRNRSTVIRLNPTSTLTAVTESTRISDDTNTNNYQLAEPNAIPAPFENTPSETPGFNIVITNVTSLPADAFEPDPEDRSPMTVESTVGQTEIEQPDKIPPPPEDLDELPLVLREKSIPPLTSTSKTIKRNYPDEDIDCQILSEGPKRARLDGSFSESNVTSEASFVSAQSDLTEKIVDDSLNHQPVISNSLESSHATSSPGSFLGTSGTSTLDNCIGDAAESGQTVAQSSHVDNGGSRATRTTATTTTGTASTSTVVTRPELTNGVATTVPTFNKRYPRNESVDYNSDSSARTSDKLSFRSLECSSSSHHEKSAGDDGNSSSKSNSSGNRTGLNLPEYVRLSDIKFKICGSKLQLSYGARKFQVKMKNGLRKSSVTANRGYKKSTSMFSFAGSNKNLPSKNNRKSIQLRSDALNESEAFKKSTRSQSIKSFIYEDDNTLLEYPTSTSSSVNSSKNRNLRKSLFEKCDSRSGRTDLKENWNPEVNLSNNNTHDNSLNNVSQISSLDSIDSNIDPREKLTESNTSSQSQKDMSINQRSLRRSGRHIRHFSSVQESDFTLNGQMNGTSMDSAATDSISQLFIKQSQSTLPDQTVKDSKTSKIIEISSFEEENKLLKIVDPNDSKVTLVSKVDSEIGAVEDSKVKTDVQNNIKLNSLESNIFFKFKNSTVKKSKYCKIEEKLKVEFKFGEKKFLVKSQSIDCLSSIGKNRHLPFTKNLSKSLNDLSSMHLNDLISLTDKAEDTEKKVRRSERGKRKFSETYESV